MARLWVGAALAVLGLVAAVMAAGGLPWSMRPMGAPVPLSAAATERAPHPKVTLPSAPASADDPARQLTDLALRQLRPSAAPVNPDDMAALTRAVVRDLRRAGGTTALERAVRQSPKPAPADDAYVAALLTEAKRGGMDTADQIRARLSDVIARPAPRP